MEKKVLNRGVVISPDSHRKLIEIQFMKSSGIARPTLKTILEVAIDNLYKKEIEK